MNADTISINTTVNALIAMSQGVIQLEGDANISAPLLVETRGSAKTYINKSGNAENVVLSGNIDFTYDSQTSGTPIDATVDITLNGGGL